MSLKDIMDESRENAEFVRGEILEKRKACTSCGADMSPLADACPKCGHPSTAKQIQGVGVILFIIGIAVVAYYLFIR